jgi:hypothetical protein
MFLLGIFSGVLICIVGLWLCLHHRFWIIDSWWSTNLSAGQEEPMVFLLKAWSCLLEGVCFHTTYSLELVYKTFLDMKNTATNELVHKNDMAKVL